MKETQSPSEEMIAGRESHQNEPTSSGISENVPFFAGRTRRSLVFVLILAAFFVVAACFIILPGEKDGDDQVSQQHTSSASFASTRVAQVKAYSLVQANTGLMQPAIDAQGNIWVSEMSFNELVRLDERTGKITTWNVPHAANGIMRAVLDRAGNVWFAEQVANYLGRFDPVTQHFTFYPLPSFKGQSAGPQDLQFNRTGKLWFTEISAGQIGRLDPATGHQDFWSLAHPGTTTPLYPYALTIASDGEVWSGMFSGGMLVSLNPQTGKITLHHLSNPLTQITSISADNQGHIWFTEIPSGMIGRIESTTGAVTEIPLPTQQENASEYSNIAIAPTGSVWIADPGRNALLRYAPQTKTFTLFQLSVRQSTPYGLVFDEQGNLWFTASGATADYIGVVQASLSDTLT